MEQMVEEQSAYLERMTEEDCDQLKKKVREYCKQGVPVGLATGVERQYGEPRVCWVAVACQSHAYFGRI